MYRFKLWKINRINKKIKAMLANRFSNQPNDEALKKEIAYYFELASLFKSLIGNKKFPHAHVMLIESLRSAASLDNPEAHYQLGKMFLEEAKFRQHLLDEGIFNSSANQKQCTKEFEEAHAHLSAAEQLHHIEATRLKGLCFINGWGLTVDKNKGFGLVVDSIEQEGSWDKVPQIFAAIGLNKPEFFSAIMQRKKDIS